MLNHISGPRTDSLAMHMGCVDLMRDGPVLLKNVGHLPELRNWESPLENLDFPPDNWLRPGHFITLTTSISLRPPPPIGFVAFLQCPTHPLKKSLTKNPLTNHSPLPNKPRLDLRILLNTKPYLPIHQGQHQRKGPPARPRPPSPNPDSRKLDTYT